MPGSRRRGRPRKAWMDNIKTWTGLTVEESVRMAEDRDKWRKYVHGVASRRIEDGYRTEQNRTRPDQTHGPLGSPTSAPTLSHGRGLVRSVSTCADFVRGSGRVGSGRRRSPWVRVVEFVTDQTLSETWSGRVLVVEFRNDMVRPDQRQSLVVGRVPNSAARTRPDPTRSADWSETRAVFGHYLAFNDDTLSR